MTDRTVPEQYQNPAAVLALLDERDVIAESLGGMIEWMAEVICDAREALVAERLRYVGDLRGSRPPGKVPIDMGAVLAILNRERNADPSRFDALRAAHDAEHARALRAEEAEAAAVAAVERVRVLIAPVTEMAETTAFGQRCFTEADIRRALDGEAPS